MKSCHAASDLLETICPMSFGVAEIRNADGTGYREGGPWHCVGPKCMAWRWVETHIKDPQGGSELVLSGDTHGYCGMAGNTLSNR